MSQMLKHYKKLAIVDGSYFLIRSLKVPELWELKYNGQRTGGIFGFLRSLGSELVEAGYYPVVCWDAGLSPRRTQVYPAYKRNHIKLATRLLRPEDSDEDAVLGQLNESVGNYYAQEAMEQARESLATARRRLLETGVDEDAEFVAELHRQRDIIINILKSLGVPSLLIKGWEGDDLMVLCTRLAQQSVVMSDDKDLIQLISPNVDIVRPMRGERLHYDEYMKANDYQDPLEICIIKAIIGDPSDNIPSVTHGLERKYSLGATRGKHVAKLICESNENPEIYLEKLKEENKNYYNGFIMKHEDYLRNMELVDLRLVPNDEEVINEIVSTIDNQLGKFNLLSALRTISEQGITKFDTNGFMSKVIISYRVMTQDKNRRVM